jgi:hypothetical protein
MGRHVLYSLLPFYPGMLTPKTVHYLLTGVLVREKPSHLRCIDD